MYSPTTKEALAAALCCGGRQIMKHAILWSLMLALCFAALHAAPQDSNPPMPRYAGQNLMRPENYREWIFLSSGLGMNYNPSPGGHEMFTNVFVPQSSYRKFPGQWKVAGQDHFRRGG